MYTGKKEMILDGPSYYQDSNRRFPREDTVQSLRMRLSTNLAKMLQLFRQRKELIMRYAEILMTENSNKLEHIAKAKINDLKNQARILKDQLALNLIQNAQRYHNYYQRYGSGNKNILQTIMDSNVKNIEVEQSKKSKLYYDEINRIDSQRTSTMNRFKIQAAQISKFTDQQRKYFRDIQILEQQKISLLTLKQQDHIKKAQKIEQEIQKIKLILKNNKINKDKKKRQLSFQIDKIIEVTKRHQIIAGKRYNQIIDMFGGYQTIEQFDLFFKNFQTVVTNKIQSKREDEKIIKELVKLATYFQAEVEDLQKLSQDQTLLFDDLADAFRKNITLALLERAYLSNVPTDKNNLINTVGKCQHYRSILDKLAQQKLKARRQIQKASKVLDYFQPQLKAITTQEKRKQELRQKISRIMTSRIELQKMQRKQKNFQFQLSNILLQKEALIQQQQQAARKGNLQQYKQKTVQLQKIEQQIVLFSQNKNDAKYNEQQARLNLQIQQLNREYSDIIQEILIQQKEMSCFVFLEKLNKRLLLV